MINDVSEDVPVSESSVEVQAQEKMVPASKIDEIIREKYAKAFNKGKAEGIKEAEDFYKSNQTAHVNQSNGGSVDEDKLRQVIGEIFNENKEAYTKAQEEQRLKAESEKASQEIFEKFEESRKKYEDFDEETQGINYNYHAPVLLLANEFDNTGDIFYELSKKPQKLITIHGLLHAGEKGKAMQQLRKISDSIKNNETAVNSKKPPRPLNQIKSSNIAGDSGSKGYVRISDLRKQSYLMRPK